MKKKLINIYNIFFEIYGPQGWWPLSGLNKLLSKDDKDWFSYKKAIKGEEEYFIKYWPRHVGAVPATGAHKFEIITGALLTQNTSWTNVELSLYQLNKTKNNTIDKLKDISEEYLSSLIKSSGYQNQKAKRLKGFANYFESEKKLDEFFKSSKEKVLGELFSLKGVGPETRDSIALYAGGFPVFVIDAYTKRIFSRIFNLDSKKNYDYWQSLFMNGLSHMENKVEIFKEYHGLIVKHGKEFCKTKPLCEKCFLKECKHKIHSS